jgi:transcriptional regulator with XRE-family HTH domain
VLHLNITARREALGMRKIDLARKCNVGKSRITAWEAGTVPRPATLEKIAKALRTTVSNLYRSAA